MAWDIFKKQWYIDVANAKEKRSNDTRSMNLLTRFLAWANNQFNPQHDWFDYASMDNRMKGAANGIMNQITQENLTGAQQQMNAFNAEEAQKQREWEEMMSNTAYQRAVKDMQAAGVNPALAMSNGSASTPSGSSASSVSPLGGINMSDLMSAIMLPLQRKLIKSQAKMYEDQGEAALMQGQASLRNAGSNERNAGANEMNAQSNARQASVAERNADVNEVRVSIEKYVADSNVKVNDKQIGKLAEEISYYQQQPHSS